MISFPKKALERLAAPITPAGNLPSYLVRWDWRTGRKKKVIPLIYFKHPIEIGDGDWAIGLTKKGTVLYSRYPFGGKQIRFRYNRRLDAFDERDWDNLINGAVKKTKMFCEAAAPSLASDLIKFRRQWLFVKR